MQTIMAEDFVQKGGKGELNILGTSLIQSLKEEPVGTIRELVRTCERGMQSRSDVWERYSKKYRRGLRYISQDGAKEPLYSTNYLFNVVETLKANLTANMPALVMKPVEDGDDVAADLFTKILRLEMKKANLKAQTERVVQHAAITGCGWYKVWFDENGFFGKGAIVLDAIAPEDVLVLPTMLDYQTSDLFIHRLRDLPESQIKAKYGVDKIEGAPEHSMIQNDRSNSADRKMTNIRTFNVYECWVKDYESDEWYIATLAGSTLLRKPEKSPYKHNCAPFVPWYDGVDVRADQAYNIGVGELEEIEMLQDMADAMDMRIYKNIKQITGRQRVLNPASGINRQDVDDSPNRVYLCTGDPQKAMVWDNPPALSQDVYTYREKIEDRIQVVSGIFDVTQGKKPSGIQAARAVSALQSAAAKRIEKKSELLNFSIQDVGRLASSIILQFYTDTRIIRLGGDRLKIAGEYPPELQTPDDFEDKDSDVIDALHQKQTQWKEQNQVSLVMADIDFNYDITASTDSALPEDEADRVQLITDMFRLGLLDRQAALEGLDYPDREAILRRLAGGVTGKTPAEAMPENQAGMKQAQDAKAQSQNQGQQAQQAAQMQAQQQMAQQAAQQKMAQQGQQQQGQQQQQAAQQQQEMMMQQRQHQQEMQMQQQQADQKAQEQQLMAQQQASQQEQPQ